MKWGIANIKGGGGDSNTMLTTTTDATENSGTYTLALTYLSETPKVNDYVVYVNSGIITTLYQVSAIGSNDATLTKIGDIGGGGGGSGTTLYQHNIELAYQGHNYNLVITSESDTLIDTPTKLKDWFNSNYKNKHYRMVGWYLITTTAYLIVKSIKVNNNAIYVSGLQVDNGTPTLQTSYAITGDFTSLTITDNVIAL